MPAVNFISDVYRHLQTSEDDFLTCTLHSSRRRLQTSPDVSRRLQMLTALISLLDSKKSQHARETYQDRGGAHFMTTYSDDQALKLAKAGLFKDVDTPQMLRAGRWSVWCLV
jgi:hypothetical protein